jgi:signal transduction histidine kinase
MQPVARVVAVGIAAAILIAGIGPVAQRLAIGADDAAAAATVERDVRGAFGVMTRQLSDRGRSVASATTLRAAARGDSVAARALFTAASTAVLGEDDVAVTVYAPDGTALAWAGRASELIPQQLQGGETWFLAQGPLGLRLVYIHPIDDGGTRAGVVAAERSVPLVGGPTRVAPPGRRDGGVDAYRFPTTIAPVSLYLPSEGAPGGANVTTFEVASPSGGPLLAASLSLDDIEVTRERWRRASRSTAGLVLAIALLLAAALLMRGAMREARGRAYALRLAAAALLVFTARAVLWAASPASWWDASLFSGARYASPLLPPPLSPLLGSPADFVLTIATLAVMVWLALHAVETWRLRHPRRLAVDRALGRFVAAQIGAGIAVALIIVGHQQFVGDTIAHATTIDLLQFSLRPFSAARLALQVGLVIVHAAAVGLGVAVLRAGLAPWRRPPGDVAVLALTAAAWAAPYLAWQLAPSGDAVPLMVPGLIALAVIGALALTATRIQRRYRHGSQAFRLSLLMLALVVPACALYFSVFRKAWDAKIELVETTYAPQAINQRQTVLQQMKASLEQIDQFPGLAELLSADLPVTTESSTGAFQVWQSTELSLYPITSSVELYGPDRALLSRFAFNLPEDLAARLSEEQTCGWELYEGVAPFFAEERRVLHAGRLVCADDTTKPPLGSVVVRAILDYENLPFIFSNNPYVELMRPSDPQRDQPLAGHDVEYAVYGWSRTPSYQTGDTAWSLPDDVFARIERSRAPLWTRLLRGGEVFDVYVQNDRGGIYALGFPVVSSLGHLVNVAEVAVLAAGTFLLLLFTGGVIRVLAGGPADAPALLREVRASFYRKLFIAFVLAVFVPVVLLAIVTRNYVADQMRASIEQEAVRTASAARRVVEDLVAPRAQQAGVVVDDNLMVWVSRLIDQDVNVFAGARLQATSERNLFASGLLPTRTPAEAYHAIELRREAATVTTERIGGSEHLVAATPLTERQLGSTLLSVPLTSRQREIDQQIETLDRRVLLFVLLFVLGGAAIGYRLAERISDPVSRLTRATRRIARGELDIRIAATSSDELRRLVDNFNSMAAELLRQRRELERTHRLEAWAEMARQVAHDIKNPLTPIQLNAEHLRRVHTDRGRPLGQVLDDCVDTILTQVKLLRQIASEFSSFASSPTARPGPVDVREMLIEIVDPYRLALAERMQFVVDLPASLPVVWADRTLIMRALTNVVENALHAMPGNGTLRVAAAAEPEGVRIVVTDTGGGMDADALARVFEPYFSTKATGTGLGLPIAKRNVELNGGRISVQSERDTGTTVEMILPLAATA